MFLGLSRKLRFYSIVVWISVIFDGYENFL